MGMVDHVFVRVNSGTTHEDVGEMDKVMDVHNKVSEADLDDIRGTKSPAILKS